MRRAGTEVPSPLVVLFSKNGTVVLLPVAVALAKLTARIIAPKRAWGRQKQAQEGWNMKRSLLVIALILTTFCAANPAAAQNRYIVQSNGGLGSVLNLCGLLGCQVNGGLDGVLGQLFSVTSSTNLLSSTVS